MYKDDFPTDTVWVRLLLVHGRSQTMQSLVSAPVRWAIAVGVDDVEAPNVGILRECAR